MASHDLAALADHIPHRALNRSPSAVEWRRTFVVDITRQPGSWEALASRRSAKTLAYFTVGTPRSLAIHQRAGRIRRGTQACVHFRDDDPRHPADLYCDEMRGYRVEGSKSPSPAVVLRSTSPDEFGLSHPYPLAEIQLRLGGLAISFDIHPNAIVGLVPTGAVGSPQLV